MVSEIRDFDEDALEMLDRFLMSDRAPEDSLSISELDGLLTAVAVGPDLIAPSEWLTVVWGGDRPDFESPDEASAVLSAIMGRYNQILRQLERNELAPLFWTGPEGQVLAADWAEGFMDGVRLRIDAWEALLRDDDDQSMLFPILVLSSDELGNNPLGLEPDERTEIAFKVPDLIPDCAWGIYQFWRERESLRSAPARNNKAGRNEPCPCGSGKKHKRCCGGTDDRAGSQAGPRVLVRRMPR